MTLIMLLICLDNHTHFIWTDRYWKGGKSK